MKRTLERILFMVIGASIAFTSYLVGNADKTADAQNQHIQCDTLTVRDWIMVSDTADAGLSLSSNQGNPAIRMFTGYVDDFNKSENLIAMGINDDQNVNIIQSRHLGKTGFELNATSMHSVLSLHYGDDRLKPDKSMQIWATENNVAIFANGNAVYRVGSDPSAATSSLLYLDPIVVDVIHRHIDLIGNDIFILAADVILPNGQKINIKFDNAQINGMFKNGDKIRIKQKGEKWEFIERIP